mgnify:CR=1 FL=1
MTERRRSGALVVAIVVLGLGTALAGSTWQRFDPGPTSAPTVAVDGLRVPHLQVATRARVGATDAGQGPQVGARAGAEGHTVAAARAVARPRLGGDTGSEFRRALGCLTRAVGGVRTGLQVLDAFLWDRACSVPVT